MMSQHEPNKITKRIVALSKSARQPFDKSTAYKLNEIRKTQQALFVVSRSFAIQELKVVIHAFESRKAPWT